MLLASCTSDAFLGQLTLSKRCRQSSRSSMGRQRFPTITTGFGESLWKVCWHQRDLKICAGLLAMQSLVVHSI